MVKPPNGAPSDWQSTVSEQQAIQEAKSLICEICRNFYQHGWVSGTGGGMSIKVGEKIVMAPSGVQKERMQETDMFVLDEGGNIIQSPQPLPPPAKPPKLSECSPLFMSAYELRGAGAVLHSHSINAVMATLLQEGNAGRGCVGEFRVTNLEMIKGITGHGYYDECVVPIIENTARECELTASLREAMQNYPKANAVLVKRHGVYVWGDNWIQAKTQAECYEYLFEAAVRLKGMGTDVSRAPPRPAAENGEDGSDEEDSDEEESSDGENPERAAAAVLSGSLRGRGRGLTLIGGLSEGRLSGRGGMSRGRGGKVGRGSALAVRGGGVGRGQGRGRGRGRAVEVSQDPNPGGAGGRGGGYPASGKKLGRPPSKGKAAVTVARGRGRGRGRPPKAAAVVGGYSALGVKRGRGRPPKVNPFAKAAELVEGSGEGASR